MHQFYNNRQTVTAFIPGNSGLNIGKKNPMQVGPTVAPPTGPSIAPSLKPAEKSNPGFGFQPAQQPKTQPQAKKAKKKKKWKIQNAFMKAEPDTRDIGTGPNDNNNKKHYRNASTQTDSVGPQGETPYRDGQSFTLDSLKLGKIGELPLLKQIGDDGQNFMTKLGNIRTLFQVIEPKFLGQHAVFGTATLTNLGDTTHTEVFREFFNKMNQEYQSQYSVNSTFSRNFIPENVYVYFSDTFRLFAELVCLLQRAAYYREQDREMENPLLDNLAVALNTDVIDNLRNAMARTLRYQFLPTAVVTATYEKFQSFRCGPLGTSTSMTYITPAMYNLISSLGLAKTESDVQAAVASYELHVKSLIKLCISRGPQTEEGDGYDLRRYIYIPKENDKVSGEWKFDNFFNQDEGGLSADERRKLNISFTRLKDSCNLWLLNKLPQGNSQTHWDMGFGDEFNNRPCLNGIEMYPRAIGDNAAYLNSRYCAEVHGDDILYKNVEPVLELFLGTGPLLFVTSNIYNRGYLTSTTSNQNFSKFYGLEKEPNLTIRNEFDTRFFLKSHYADLTSVRNFGLNPFVQDNYVTKVFSTAGSYLPIANPDASSVGNWYVTLGDLLNIQMEEGKLMF